MPLFPSNNLNWSTVVKEHSVLLYSNASDDAVRPLLSKDYSSIDDINQDILSIAQTLQSSANMHIPAKIKKPHHKQKIYDKMLSNLCWKSRCAFRRWKEANRPRRAELYDDRRKCKRDVQQYLNKKRAILERKRIQKRDNMFNDKHPHRFRSNTVSKHIPPKLLVNNTLITDPSCVLSTWAEHFESLSKSQITSSVPLTEIQKRVHNMERCSFN